MRRYETIVIAHPSLSPEERQPFFDKLTDIIVEGQGFLVKADEWGQKKLAYEIKKETRGYYILFDYCGGGDLVKELERNIRLDDRSLKYMTVCAEQEADVEAIKADIEAAKQKETATAETAPATAPAEGATEAAAETSEPVAAPEETPQTDTQEEATDGAHKAE